MLKNNVAGTLCGCSPASISVTYVQIRTNNSSVSEGHAPKWIKDIGGSFEVKTVK